MVKSFNFMPPFWFNGQYQNKSDFHLAFEKINDIFIHNYFSISRYIDFVTMSIF